MAGRVRLESSVMFITTEIAHVPSEPLPAEAPDEPQIRRLVWILALNGALWCVVLAACWIFMHS
nr:hypothetical protein TQ38_21370 [Novosphingobium sp. P6W]